MIDVLTVCMPFHCLNNFVVGCILSQQTLIIAGNNDPIVCNNDRSLFLNTITI